MHWLAVSVGQCGKDKMEMPAWFMVQGLTNLGAVADYITLLQKQAAAAVRRERLLKREIAELKANAEHEPRAAASRAPCSCSALTKACERTIKYLREIGESTRGESAFPSAEYADAMADDLEHVLKQNAAHDGRLEKTP
jgi:hypothetical protein